jgi:hypothetical protein
MIYLFITWCICVSHDIFVYYGYWFGLFLWFCYWILQLFWQCDIFCFPFFVNLQVRGWHGR